MIDIGRWFYNLGVDTINWHPVFVGLEKVVKSILKTDSFLIFCLCLLTDDYIEIAEALSRQNRMFLWKTLVGVKKKDILIFHISIVIEQ